MDSTIDENALIKSLEDRLLAMERLLLGSDRSASSINFSQSRQPGQDLLNKVNTMQKVLQSKEQAWSAIHSEPVLDLYEKMEKQIEAYEEETLDPAAKLEIILETSETTAQLAEAASTFNTHQRFINSEHISKVDDYESELKPLSEVHLEQIEQAEQLNQHFHSILQSYNETVNLLSQKFVFWDSLLKLAEQEVARRQQK